MVADTSALLGAAQRYEQAKTIKNDRREIPTAARAPLETVLEERKPTDGKLRDADAKDGRAHFLYPEERLAYERRIGSDDLKPIRYFELGLLAARAVARIVVPNIDPRGDMLGTGFLVAPGLLVTNNHVLEEPYWAEAARVEFGAEDDLKGRPRQPELFSLDPGQIFFTDKGLDYTVVAVKPRSLTGGPIENFGYIRVFIETGKIREGEYANLIQHPSGRQKEVSIRNNRIVVYNPDGTALPEQNNFLYYEADTEGGSSGAPVFSDQWYLVALHRRGVPRTKVVAGKQVIMRKDGKPAREGDADALIDYVANEGIRASRIVKHITAAVEAGDAMAMKVYERWKEVRAAPLDGPLPLIEAANAAPVAAPIGKADLELAIRPAADFANAEGHNPLFLGAGSEVPLPDMSSEVLRDAAPLLDGSGHILNYDNFSVVMNARRRTAFFAAWNVDRPKLFEPVGRPKWSADPRMDARFQPDDRIFALQLDRGAIVRRKDVVWGAKGERAHAHTFCLTNILPQVQEPGGQGWGDLEDHILAAAAPADGKLSIFAGPFFSADDPSYDDLRRQSPGQRFQRTAMRIPLITWLIAVWVGGGQIKAAGFLRDQREGLERTGPLELSFGGAVLKQTLIGRIEERTGLAFGGLAQRDTFLNQGFEERTLSRASDMII